MGVFTMSVNKRTQDQRKSFRFPATSVSPPCELRVGEETASARLMDESAGGFSIVVGGLSQELTKQKAQLLVKGVWYNVDIVHVQEIIPPEDEAELIDRGPWFRLGLRRLGEVAVEAPSGGSILSVLSPSLLSNPHDWMPFGGTFASLGIFLVIAIVAVSLGMAITHWCVQSQDSPKAVSSASRPSEKRTGVEPIGKSTTREDSRQSPAAYSHAAPSSARQPQASPSSTGGQPVESRGASTLLPDRSSFRRLSGAASFTLPEVVTRLQLTSDQQRQIDAMMETTSKAIRSLDQQFKDTRRHEIAQRRTQLLEQAYRQAIELLSDEQRAEWQKLSGEQ
jgi:hypothetical protein